MPFNIFYPGVTSCANAYKLPIILIPFAIDILQEDDVDNLYYIAGFSIISAGMIVATGLMAFSSVVAMYLAAKHIHFDMIRNIFGSYLRYVYIIIVFIGKQELVKNF